MTVDIQRQIKQTKEVLMLYVCLSYDFVSERVIANTVKFLNFQKLENFAVIYLKFKQRGQALGYFVKKIKMEEQTVQTLIRLLLKEQSDLGLH